MGNDRLYKAKKQAAIEGMGGECQICGYSKCHRTLHFHHVNPKSKDFSFTGIAYIDWIEIENELKKCILVCANCHGEIHANVTSIPKKYTKYNSKLIKTSFQEFLPVRKNFLDRDWSEIQNYYNSTKCNTKELCKKFNVSAETIAKARDLHLFVYKNTFTKEQILEAVLKSKSRVEVLKNLGVESGRQNCSKKVKKWIEKYDIDISHFTRSKYIKKTS